MNSSSNVSLSDLVDLGLDVVELLPEFPHLVLLTRDLVHLLRSSLLDLQTRPGLVEVAAGQGSLGADLKQFENIFCRTSQRQR